MGCSASRTNTLLTRNNHTEEPCSSSSLDSTTTTTTTTVSSHSSPKVPRALSLPTPLVHHPPSRKGDTHHLVSLTSTTYGSLLLIDHQNPKINGQDCSGHQPPPPNITINTHKTQIQTDPGDNLSPDSVINTWELMDGLDDFDLDLGKPDSSISDRQIDFPTKPNSFHYMGTTVKRLSDIIESLKPKEIIVENSSSTTTTTTTTPSVSKPLWKHLSEEALLSKLDPNVVSSYRRALSSRQLGSDKSMSTRSLGSSPITSSLSNNSWLCLPGTEDRIVLYFTSLRGIRKTYENCCEVRMIFKGFRVPVDERDISMDCLYRKELQSLLGGKAISLPQVFIRGKHVGGVEEVKQLNEAGELANLLKGFPVRDPRIVCESCGDARFVPCSNCNGSRKVFEEEEGQLRRCPDCNENGLIRCPGCCS